MGVFMFFVFCSLMGSVATAEIKLDPDRPFLRVQFSDTADLKCCYKDGPLNFTWIKSSSSKVSKKNQMDQVILSEDVVQNYTQSEGKLCGILTLRKVKLSDTGLYQCFLNKEVQTHGTYLQVFRPMEKTLNLSESTKNKILTAEGVLLLLCVVIPSASLLLKSKSLNRLEMKKMKHEEENIYQGLNLEDCCTTYDQIERSQAQSQYQDVCNAMEEKEESLLEKP
ncbi:B-cell antigen receptor complex-associated protein alpha chain [Girardinichthys multiradiatus]|uniref:B-cell antigen receptor complex-associated protein alpha chain n=1 Tax=Girardinichthys multiradiatus TaxID=208333 RepID=UPI001FADD9D1|nr:B-cell antigen receptor complex-associated protein alpha chain [Girardinichthys multiradiatus]